MRVWSRVALVAVLVFSAPLFADHFKAECPLSLVDATPAATDFELSPHGVFRSGSTVFALRGNVLTTYTVNDVGNLQIGREDFVGSLAARETNGGVAFSAGFLYISSEAGLEIYDLRNTRAGGTAPVLVTRIAGLHYRRLAVNGNRLAGLYPGEDLICAPAAPNCTNAIDIYDITTVSAPLFRSSITPRSTAFRSYIAFNDIAFNSGLLIAAADGGVGAFDLTDAFLPNQVNFNSGFPGKWLVTAQTSNIIGVGNEKIIDILAVRPGMSPFFQRLALVSAPMYLTVERGNDIRFHPKAWYDETTNRLITMIDEIDPQTLDSARTIAFDVFDFTVPFLEGSAERVYEDLTMTVDDERKYNPVAVGPFVYVIGERTGVQSWGACGQVNGRIELDSPTHLTCNGAELHGWVSGAQKIVAVELFLDNTTLGAAALGGPPRFNVSSTTPVATWRINVNLDATARGEHLLRAIGTDILGNRRQFASKRLFFAGPGQNCTVPRRRAVR
jgi:hypothetical protein